MGVLYAPIFDQKGVGMKFPEKFICASEEKNEYENHLCAPYFRKIFTLNDNKNTRPFPTRKEVILFSLSKTIRRVPVHLEHKNVTR